MVEGMMRGRGASRGTERGRGRGVVSGFSSRGGVSTHHREEREEENGRGRGRGAGRGRGRSSMGSDDREEIGAESEPSSSSSSSSHHDVNAEKQQDHSSAPFPSRNRPSFGSSSSSSHTLGMIPGVPAYLQPTIDWSSTESTPFRLFVCPIPASCAAGHSAADASNKHTSNWDEDDSSDEDESQEREGPVRVCDGVNSLLETQLRQRFEGFAQVSSIELVHKRGVPASSSSSLPLTPSADTISDPTARIHAQPPSVPASVSALQSCTECSACPHCCRYDVRHFAYVDIIATPQAVVRISDINFMHAFIHIID